MYWYCISKVKKMVLGFTRRTWDFLCQFCPKRFTKRSRTPLSTLHFSDQCQIVNHYRTTSCPSCGLSVVGGSEMNRLWCVATGMSGKQCHSKCSEWPLSALIQVSSLFQHWSVAKQIMHAVLKFSLCCNKPLPQASTCPYQYTRSSCSVPQTQY